MEIGPRVYRMTGNLAAYASDKLEWFGRLPRVGVVNQGNGTNVHIEWHHHYSHYPGSLSCCSVLPPTFFVSYSNSAAFLCFHSYSFALFLRSSAPPHNYSLTSHHLPCRYLPCCATNMSVTKLLYIIIRLEVFSVLYLNGVIDWIFCK